MTNAMSWLIPLLVEKTEKNYGEVIQGHVSQFAWIRGSRRKMCPLHPNYDEGHQLDITVLEHA